MSLRIIAGRSGGGKTEFCLNEIVAYIDKAHKKNLIYLVPEQATLHAQKELILRTEKQSSMQAYILNFQSLAYHIFLETGRVNRKILGDIGENLLLRKILNDLKDELSFFKVAANKQGFMQNLNQIISEFFQYNVTPETLERAVQSLGDKELLRLKMEDLQKIYFAYLDNMSEKYISSDANLDLLAEKIPESNFLKESIIWIDDFSFFSPQDYRVLEKLLLQAEQVNVTLCVNNLSEIRANDSFAEPKTTATKLQTLAAEHHVPIEEPVFLKTNYRLAENPVLLFLEKQYLAHTNMAYSGEVEQIRLIQAQNIYEEITETAKQIRRLLIQQKYRYKDIAVVTGVLPDYEPTLKGIFRKFDIPIFLDSKLDILSHPLTELVRSTIEMVVKNRSYESVFRFLKTGMTSLSQQNIDKMENYVLAYGIKGKKWTTEWIYGFDAPYESFDKEELNACREQFLAIVKPFAENLYRSKKSTVRALSERMFSLLESMKVTDWLETWTDESAVTEQIWGKITSVFDKMVELLGDDVVTVEEYGKILESGLESMDLGLIPPTQDQVTIGDLERSRLPNIKALFVLGVNEGVIPSAVRESGILSDEERGFVTALDIELAPTKRQKAFYENFLIYSRITKPSEFLQLSYVLGDLGGQSKQPSSLIGKIKTMFPRIEETQAGAIEDVSASKHEFSMLANALKRYSMGEAISERDKALYRYFSESDLYKEKLKKVERFLENTHMQTKLNKRLLNELYKERIETSVSKLEKYVSCPFAYFAQYILQLKERKLYQIESLEIGSFYHSIIEEFFRIVAIEKRSIRDLTDTDIAELTGKSVARMKEIERQKKNDILFSSSRNAYFMTRIENISKRTIWALSQHIQKGEFEPTFNELGFSKPYGLQDEAEMIYEPIVIRLDNGIDMYLSGKIDRVDIMEWQGKEYVKVIDYKSGHKKLELGQIFHGKQLQLALYLDAFMQKATAAVELAEGAVLYFTIGNPIVEYSGGKDSDEIEKSLLKTFKMSGLVLKEKDIIRGMDREFSSSSEILPVSSSSKDESGIRDTESVLTSAEFQKLRKYVYQKIKDLGEQIVDGNIQAKPSKYGDDTGCRYCRYQSICQVDTRPADQKYNKLLRFKDKESVLQEMMKKLEGRATL